MSKKPPDANLVIGPEEKSPLKALGGSDRQGFNNFIVNAAIDSGWYFANPTEKRRQAVRESTVSAMMGFQPTDEIEGMIAAQAVAMHHATMECSRRAMIPEQPGEAAHALRKAAANSSRAFVALLDALDRKRGKSGQQKIKVEHVHVHAGGKAIVGSVSQSSEGGGGATGKTAGEPRTPSPALEHDATSGAVLPPLWSKDQNREPLPVAGNGQRKMPDARRRKHGTSDS